MESLPLIDSWENYDIARMGWVGDYDDPNSFLDMWITDGGNNRTGWSNAAYDSLIELASRTADKDSRFAIFREAEKILLSELPVIPLYFYTNVTSCIRQSKDGIRTCLTSTTSNS
jgi:oligopeptide transport system substrate-binding protein